MLKVWNSLFASYPNPVLKSSNADADKFSIIKRVKGKSGVYRWINNTNGKSYVGSSVDLSKRLYRYYSLAHLIDGAKNSYIYRALIKYGYGSFSFEILEFCNKENVLEREQYYLDLLKPEYNVLLKAGSPLGYKHTEGAKEKMRGIRKLSQERLKQIRANIALLNVKRAIPVQVLDQETGTEFVFESVRETVRQMKFSDRTVKKYLDSGEPFKGRYIISSIKK